MNLHRVRLAAAACIATLLFTAITPAQDQGGDKVDLAALTQIKNEAFQHSQVMENLFYTSEVYGPRVNNSRNHRAAAEWAMQQMKTWGLENVHLENGDHLEMDGKSGNTMARSNLPRTPR